MAHENKEREGLIDALFERTKDYVETRADLYRLKAIRKMAEVGSSIISKVILAVVFSSFFLMLNVGLSLWLGDLMNRLYLGFFAVAGFYLIVGVIVYANRQKILRSPIADSIIKKIND
ncbi:MAG: hypothetical protein ACKVOM_07565 [Ferruginibacter sp.]